jgi:hypothetical protein
MLTTPIGVTNNIVIIANGIVGKPKLIDTPLCPLDNPLSPTDDIFLIGDSLPYSIVLAHKTSKIFAI